LAETLNAYMVDVVKRDKEHDAAQKIRKTRAIT